MRKLFLALILMSSAMAWAADKIQPLNVKVGLWECTMTSIIGGQPPVPAEMLSQLTPQQRARLEERMKADSGARTNKSVYKSCVTREKLADGEGFENRKECTQKVMTSTSSKLDMHVVCDQEGVKSAGTVHLDVLNPETVKGTGQMTVSGNGQSMSSNLALSAKWIGSSCGDVQ